jgi:hypothetical protein
VILALIDEAVPHIIAGLPVGVRPRNKPKPVASENFDL